MNTAAPASIALVPESLELLGHLGRRLQEDAGALLLRDYRATFERALQAVHNRRQLPLTREEYELADEIERCSETALCVLQVVWDAMHEGPG